MGSPWADLYDWLLVKSGEKIKKKFATQMVKNYIIPEMFGL